MVTNVDNNIIWRTLFLISVILAHGSCKSENKEQEILYYPSETEFDSRFQHTSINLDTTNLSYLDILGLIPAEDYRKYVPLFEIDDGSKKRKILPFIRSYTNRNILTVTKDSVFADSSYSIEDLNEVVHNIFQHPGSTKFYDDNFPHLANIAIDMKGKSSGREIKELLLKITRAFDLIQPAEQDSLFLRIYFDLPFDFDPTLME